jgi:hypothetical protein
LSQGQAYTVAAILVNEILHDSNTAQQQEDLSFALWELFDPNTTAGGLVGAGGNANWGSNTDSVQPWLLNNNDGTGATSDLNLATKDLEAAINTDQSVLDGYAVTIYSYVGPPTGTPPTCGESSCATAPPQEFITLTPSGNNYPNTPVPEPSELVVIGAYILFGGVSVILFGRRRIFRTNL